MNLRISKGAFLGIALLTALAVRVWWVRPVNLQPTAGLDKAQVSGSSYQLWPKIGVAVDSLVRTTLFGRYSPRTRSAFEERLSARPSKHVKVDSQHHYVEYMTETGRIRLHTALDPDGLSQWFEFFPSQLPTDRFFRPDLGILFDRDRTAYDVTILDRTEQTIMTIHAREGMVESISWIQNFVPPNY